MPEIRQLPQSVINKIAAGEVIERPASVVKELLENSVDAGAKRIDVTVETGGLQLIRVADEGCGIEPPQLTLAIAAHATSKIQDADDLFSVATLGFRGEALASIAEVSQFMIRSRTAHNDAGAQLESEGGDLSGPSPCGCPVGTTIEVRNLFFNTPVRRKFLKSAQTEFGHCSEAFTRIALANPQVHFTLRHNDRTVHDLPPVSNWRERIMAFFQGEIGDSLMWVESEDGEIRVNGYVGDPSINRANNRLQYLFLNGRCIRDRSLQHALSEAYRGLLMVGRFPIAFLKLEMPAAAVDVNVHPTKLEVRFQDSGRLYSQLLGAVRRKFLSTDLTAKAQLPTDSLSNATAPIGGSNTAAPAPLHLQLDGSSAARPPHHLLTQPGSTYSTTAASPSGMDARRMVEHQRELVQWAKGVSPSSASDSVPERPNSFSFTNTGVPAFRPFPHGGTLDRSIPTASLAGNSHTTLSAGDQGPAHRMSSAPEVAGRPAPFSPDQIGPNSGIQLQNRYLVTENDDGIVIIDQHALHERILYEQLRERILRGEMETQRLLVPETVQLSPSEAAVALDSAPTLAKLGISIEPFGGDTILVTSYPAMLANIGPAEIVRQVVDQLMSNGKAPERRDLLDELLHMVACKAAVKAGDRLSEEEVGVLLEQRHLFQDSHHCPHGRPTALVFSRDELDKRFGRI